MEDSVFHYHMFLNLALWYMNSEHSLILLVQSPIDSHFHYIDPHMILPQDYVSWCHPDIVLYKFPLENK